MSEITVKPLEWRGGRTAKVLGATWMVWPYSDPLNDGLGQWMWQVLDATPHASGRFHTIDEAKAAVQSDYERRVLSAIDLEAHKALIAARDAEISRLTHILKQRDRMAETSRKFWVRAAKAAMAGDFREIRDRVDLAEAPPVGIGLSDINASELEG